MCIEKRISWIPAFAGMTEWTRWVLVMPDLIPAEDGIFDRHPVANDAFFA